jgi:hypothetical protein
MQWTREAVESVWSHRERTACCSLFAACLRGSCGRRRMRPNRKAVRAHWPGAISLLVELDPAREALGDANKLLGQIDARDLAAALSKRAGPPIPQPTSSKCMPGRRCMNSASACVASRPPRWNSSIAARSSARSCSTFLRRPAAAPQFCPPVFHVWSNQQLAVRCAWAWMRQS